MEEKQTSENKEPELKGKMGIVWLVGILVIFLGCVTVYALKLCKENKELKQIPQQVPQQQVVVKTQETKKEEPVKAENTTALTQKETSTKTNAISTLKKYLLDDTWVKNNLYISKTVSEKKIKNSDAQNLTFTVINDTKNSYPAVIVKAELKNEIGANLYLVTYENDNVRVISITEGVIHPEHNILLANNSYVAVEYAHMGYWNYSVYTVSNGKLNEEKTGKGQLKEEDSEYIELDSVTGKYNLKEITTKLNKTNLNKFLK